MGTTKEIESVSKRSFSLEILCIQGMPLVSGFANRNAIFWPFSSQVAAQNTEEQGKNTFFSLLYRNNYLVISCTVLFNCSFQLESIF